MENLMAEKEARQELLAKYLKSVEAAAVNFLSYWFWRIGSDKKPYDFLISSFLRTFVSNKLLLKNFTIPFS